MNEEKVIPVQSMIYEIRGQKVMLDSDLAKLYKVEVKTLNRIVKRNVKRFPDDFMFRLIDEEWKKLKSRLDTSSLRYHFGTAKMIEKIRYNPCVFTEQGIAMLSGLLNSDVAINVNIQIMRAFVQLRHYVFSQNETNEQIAELRKLLMLHIESNDTKFSEHDETIGHIMQVLNNLTGKPKETRKIGF